MRQQKARLVADMLFGSMGLKPGDTIVKIQGFTFEPSSSWGAIADLLKSQDKIFIETQRTGKSMLFEIQVRESENIAIMKGDLFRGNDGDALCPLSYPVSYSLLKMPRERERALL